MIEKEPRTVAVVVYSVLASLRVEVGFGSECSVVFRTCYRAGVTVTVCCVCTAVVGVAIPLCACGHNVSGLSLEKCGCCRIDNSLLINLEVTESVCVVDTVVSYAVFVCVKDSECCICCCFNLLNRSEAVL